MPRCEGDWKGEEDLEGRGLEGIWRWIWRELEEGRGFGRTEPREDLEGIRRDLEGIWRRSERDLEGRGVGRGIWRETCRGIWRAGEGEWELDLRGGV